jgi:hypothetical protein
MLSSHRGFLCATALLIGAWLSACGKPDSPPVTRVITMAPFESIRARGAFSMDVSIGPVQKVSITGSPEAIAQVKTGHEMGRRLMIEAPRGVGEDATMTVTVVLPKLKAFYVGGDLSVSLRELDQSATMLDVSGSSDVKVSGTLEYVQVECTGTSSLDATLLSAQRVEAATSGNCSIDVRVSDLLAADLNGKSVVGYYGSPKTVKKTAEGGGSVIHRGP